MTKLKTYQLNGTAAEELAVPALFQKSEVPAQLIKDYLVALRANIRQWSASTKGRSEVNHSTKKPHRQKGTGNARQGTLAAPQYKGGGVVFGPKPKFDQHIRINRKERQAAIRHLLAEKMAADKVVIVESFGDIEQPKTKMIVSFADAVKINKRSVLFVCESTQKEGQALSSNHHANFRKSMSNLPWAVFVLANQLNGYDLACAHTLVMTKAALSEIQRWLGV